jgi:uncharacterized protein (TIGR03437 family)
LFASFLAGRSYSQNSLVCFPSAVPTIVHSEGLAERVGDIVLSCSGGTPGATFSGNLMVFLSVNVTNKLSTINTVDAELLVNTGGGNLPSGVAAQLTGASAIAFNGFSIILPASGSVTLVVTNLRGDANQLTAPLLPITAFVSFASPSNPAVSTNQFTVAIAQPGLLRSSSSNGINCTGSPLPSMINLANLLTKTRFFSTRMTEAFPTSFQPKDTFSDTGTRVMVQYSGFPAAARLFVPDFIAGSSAVTPTAGGDLGVQASGGQYAPSVSGSLLLIRVTGADQNGAGGTLAFPIPGMGTTTFTSATEIPMTKGAGSVVYEVVDANPAVQESAQFPTFVGLPPTGGATAVANASLTFAPRSMVDVASGDPVPRFVNATPQSDCAALGDCDASYFPHLVVDAPALDFISPVGGGNLFKYVRILNQGAGLMNWTATITYQNGSGWLIADPASGVNNSSLFVKAYPGTLAAGTYKAEITVDAGPLVGSTTLPVTLTISTGLTIPMIAAVENAASFQPGPVVAGSLAIIKGSNLLGKHVTVTFNNVPSTLISVSPTQIKLLVPSQVAFLQSAQMVVIVDEQSAAKTVPLAIVAPGIFSGGVLNQDNTRNGASNPAVPGSAIQILATGLASARSGVISARLGNLVITSLNAAGPSPTQPGVQQVRLTIPHNLVGTTTSLSVCAVAADPNQPVCSPPVTVYLK